MELEPAGHKPRQFITGFIAVLAVLIVTGGVSLAHNSGDGKILVFGPPSSKTGNDATGSGTGNTSENSGPGNQSSGSNSGPGSTTSGSSSGQASPPPASPSPAPSITFIYRNGTYAGDGHYVSPGGDEYISVTLGISSDKVTSSSIHQVADNPTSAMWQRKFRENYQQYVIGQPLSTLSLSKVSGSSLTSIGFNQAVDKIRAQAKN